MTGLIGIGVILLAAVCWWLGLYLINLGRGRLIVAGLLLAICAVWQAWDAVRTGSAAPGPLPLIVGVLLVVAGLWLLLRDARASEENLWLPLLRSFDGAFFTALVFGGQVALAARLSENYSSAMIGLLYGVIGTAVAVQTFAGRIQSAFDQFAFAYLPAFSKQRLNQARANLRAAADALPATTVNVPDLAALDEAEFVRLTRRALSSFGDLPRLSTSPLIYLPVIERRLATRSTPADTLERAVELKKLLAESILRLKPASGDFGTAPEWRHYNALYFPYVVGLKPYAVRVSESAPRETEEMRRESDSTVRQALDWFQREVPERTLYNWQNAAARLIALDMRTQSAPGMPSVRTTAPDQTTYVMVSGVSRERSK